MENKGRIHAFCAPMEGVTELVFRRIHYECFGGVEAYYLPFIDPTQHLELSNRERRNVLPENNAGVPCVPQVLTKVSDYFLWAAELFRDMGYTEINLNTGCPSGTVMAKGKGAGMLKDTEQLDAFLDRVCGKSALPVSVKTRIGFESPQEWERILEVYSRYPLKKLIVHARTSRDAYKEGTLRPQCWKAAEDMYLGDIVYNGDIKDIEDIEPIRNDPAAEISVMIGRGLIADPALARQMNGGCTSSREEIIHFHDRLSEELMRVYQPDAALIKLKTVMEYLIRRFDNIGKIEKQIHKARKMQELIDIDHRMFENCEMK